MVVACSAEPPRVSAPGPCVCEPKSKDHCERRDNVAAAPTKPPRVAYTPVPYDPSYIEKGILRFGVPELAAEAAKKTCPRIAKRVEAALDENEPDLLRAVHEARSVLVAEDATPAVEREITARAAFDKALSVGAAKTADAVADVVLEDILIAPSTAAATQQAFEFAYKSDSNFTESKALYLPIFRKHARVSLTVIVDETSARCASEAVALRRGRYLAVFRGKI
jgi:hypothetical protein